MPTTHLEQVLRQTAGQCQVLVPPGARPPQLVGLGSLGGGFGAAEMPPEVTRVSLVSQP